MKRIIVILSAAALLLVSSISASAQIGGYDYDPFKSYEPSANAKAADPKASDTTVSGTASKSFVEICGAYENLPKELFPYQPYYKYLKDGLYLWSDTSTDERAGYYEDRFFVSRKKEKALIQRSKEYEDGRFYALRNDSKECLPAGEHAMNSLFAAFLADPSCSRGPLCLVWALEIYNAMKSGYFEVRVSEYSTNEYSIVNTDRGEMLTLYELEPKRLERLDKLVAYAKEVAKKVDLKYLVEVADGRISEYDNNKDGDDAEFVLITLDDAMIGIELAMAHPDFASSDKAAEYKARYAKLQDDWKKVIDKNTYKEPMPTTYTVNSTVLAKERELLEERYPQYKGYQIYNLDNSWGEFGEGRMRHFAVVAVEPDPLNTRPEGYKKLVTFEFWQKKDVFGQYIDSYSIGGGDGPYLQ